MDEYIHTLRQYCHSSRNAGDIKDSEGPEVKKFILCAVITAALLAGAYYMIFFHGLYIPRDPDAPVSVNFISRHVSR